MRGQVMAYDLLFASLIAIVLLGTILLTLNSMAGALKGGREDGPVVAEVALSQLVLTPGSPSDWTDLSASSIGLAERRGVLSREKVERFISLERLTPNGELIREHLGLHREGASYEFRFEVLDAQGSAMYATSREPAGEAFVSRRVVWMGKAPVIAVLKVWRA